MSHVKSVEKGQQSRGWQVTMGVQWEHKQWME